MSPFLIVHHGIQRNYEDYRNYSMKLADETGGLVLSPEFDRERFPGQRYTMQQIDFDRKEHWPFNLVNKIVEEVSVSILNMHTLFFSCSYCVYGYKYPHTYIYIYT